MQNLSVLFFGQLTELTGTNELKISAASDTDELLQQLCSTFPKLNQAKFTIAVNNSMINRNTQLDENSVVALMPAFSGG